MPEGDAVWRTASRLHEALAGRVLTTAELRWGRLGGSDLTGASTLEVVPRGKHLLHRLDSGLTLHTHLRMDGRWLVSPRAEVRPGRLRDHRLRVVLGTEEVFALGHQLGEVDLVRTADEHRLVGHLGPDLLGEDWAARYVEQANAGGIERVLL